MNGWHFLTVLIVTLCIIGAIDGEWMRTQLEFVISQVGEIKF